MRPMKARSYVTFRSKVMCDLGVQVDHEGSSFVECACRVGMEPTKLDMMSSTELST